VSYTLSGRLQTRLAGSLPVVLAACALAALSGAWWPLEVVAIMVGVGVVADAVAYDRLLDYQPGWLAVPLGIAELAATMGIALAAGVGAPPARAVALFAGGWLGAQVLAHVVFPRQRLRYAEDGGELGGVGAAAAVGLALVAAVSGGVALDQRPPVVHLGVGVHEGPLELTHSVVLDGEPGTVVRNGIVIRADDVTVRDVTVMGGSNGIDVDGADDVVLERVRVTGATLDGIHVRRSSVSIRDCSIDSSSSLFGQGVDISYSFDRDPSSVVGCSVVGGQEGIVTHFATAHIARNHVTGTSMRAISMTEMSMGMIEHNSVSDAHGVGIFCNDHSMCEIERNAVVGTTPDHESGNLWRLGFGVLVSYNSEAVVRDNHLDANPHPARAVLGSTLHDED
jgi:Right handed beta helix region